MFQELIAAAHGVAKPLALGSHGGEAGSVGAALHAADGRIYTGVCIDLACGIGFCAEASATAEMLKQRTTCIEAVVAVASDGAVLSPCGRCREMLVQIDPRNFDAHVLLPDGSTATLRELTPHHWLHATSA